MAIGAHHCSASSLPDTPEDLLNVFFQIFLLNSGYRSGRFRYAKNVERISEISLSKMF